MYGARHQVPNELEGLKRAALITWPVGRTTEPKVQHAQPRVLNERRQNPSRIPNRPGRRVLKAAVHL
jgi:hypothetical protein